MPVPPASMPSRRIAVLGLGLLTLVLAACGTVGETPPLAEAVVGFCLDVIDSLDGPVCELDEEGERTIRVWLPGGRAVAWIDGAPRPVTSETAVDGGWRVELEVPRGAGALTLTRQDEDNELWRLRFAWTTSMRSSELEQAQAAMQTAFAESASERCRQQAGRAVALATEQRRGPGAMLAARTGAMCSGVEHKREWIAHALQIPEGPDEREVDRAALAAEYFQREGTYQQALDTVNRGLQRALRIGPLHRLDVQEALDLRRQRGHFLGRAELLRRGEIQRREDAAVDRDEMRDELHRHPLARRRAKLFLNFDSLQPESKEGF